MQTQSLTVKNNGKASINLRSASGVNQILVDEIIKALKKIDGYGSVEIYIQDYSVTQITTRNIKKTRHVLAE